MATSTDPLRAIRFDVAEQVATITLNRPERRNALDAAHGRSSSAMRFARPMRDDDVRVIVVTGAGRDFCVGADLEGGGTVVRRGARRRQRARRRAVARGLGRRASRCIAALNGAVAGVGATLPLHGTSALAGESTRIAFVFVKRGLVPEAASTWLLPRLVGMSRAARPAAHRAPGRRARGARAWGWCRASCPTPSWSRARRRSRARSPSRPAPVAVRADQAPPLAHGRRADPAAAERLDGAGVRLGDAVAGREGRRARVPREAARALDA